MYLCYILEDTDAPEQFKYSKEVKKQKTKTKPTPLDVCSTLHELTGLSEAPGWLAGFLT